MKPIGVATAEKQMRQTLKVGVFAAAALCIAASVAARADGAATGSFWQLPKEAGAIQLVMPGQAAPVTTSITDATIFVGICQDCMLPFQFTPLQAGKNCMVCGCSVNNASCMVGKPVKDGTWQSMVKQLPHGVGLVPTYIDPAKPESGLKQLVVNMRAVVLPVSGLDGQTPAQLLGLVKAIGGTKAELLDSGKLLSITLKTDYSADKAAKLEKAITGANGKITAPEAPKAV